MDVRVLGLDLGKNSCSLVGLDATGRVVIRRQRRRENVAAFAARMPDYSVAMEACCEAHHLGRQLAAHGHEVRLMSPEYLRPYVKAQKNEDDWDAEAIAAASTRPTPRFVTLKSEAQLDVQILYRTRNRLVGQRTALINQMGSLLIKRGNIVPQGRRKLRDQLTGLLSESSTVVTARIKRLLENKQEQ